MGTKLCFNCFETVDEKAEKCDSCGVLITDEIKVASKIGGNFQTVAVETDYDEELNRLEKLNKPSALDDGYFANVRKRDLYRISIITSILGILQIYTAGLIDSINEVSVLFGEKKVIDGLPLMISGFAYFVGIIGFYYKFDVMRRIYLIANLIHLWVLFRVYEALTLFTLILEYFDTSNFPIQMKEFLDDIVLLQFLMFAFALFYVFQIVYMYRRELQGIRYR